MYGTRIYTYIYHRNQLNVGKYFIHGSCGVSYIDLGGTSKGGAFKSWYRVIEHFDEERLTKLLRLMDNLVLYI